jgi:UDP-N-acetylglucosamine/UDP-N-acetylgalactosamine diphosphorylase
MIEVAEKHLQEKIEQLYHHKQEHIFQFWNQLNEIQRKNLSTQVSSIDFGQLTELIQFAKTDSNPKKNEAANLEPVEFITLEDRKTGDPEALKTGEAYLKKGEIAAVLVAGGQSTRLGYNDPKGMYPITPVRKKSLFQHHAEKIMALNKKYQVEIPWYIMTNEENYTATVEFFQKHNYWDLTKNSVFIFSQDMVPAIDSDGKLILDAPDRIFTNPDGHGGIVKALFKSQAIEDMKRRGIKYLFHFQVDNLLINICDPVFLGYHIQRQSDMSNKVLRKRDPEEKIGVICKINGKPGVVEYSDLPREEKYATNRDGSLTYWAGSIAIHMLSLHFIEREKSYFYKMPFHIARKKIPFIDENGNLITPDKENGIKFETFIFDALFAAQKTISVEVERREEFSPLKNKSGEDSIFTVHRDVCNLYGSWLESTGYKIPRNKDGNVSIKLEISPLYALNKKEFLAKKQQIDSIHDGLYIE